MAKAAQSQSTAVATTGPRIPYDESVAKEYGVDKGAWLALVDAVFPLASSAQSIRLVLSYCKARKLDPFKKVCHIVPIWNSALERNIDTVWPGIGELRTTAFRTGLYAGCDPTEFGPVKTFSFSGEEKAFENGQKVTRKRTVTVLAPEWCRITVYRMVAGVRVAFPGPTVYFLASYGKKSRWSDLPTEKWERTPSYLLEKVTEAAALRKAFPEEIGDWSSVDEAQAGFDLGGGPVIEHESGPPAVETTAETKVEEITEQKKPAEKKADKPAPSIELVTADGVVEVHPSMSAWLARLEECVDEAVDLEMLVDRDARIGRLRDANLKTLEKISTRAAKSGAAEIVEAAGKIAARLMPPADDEPAGSPEGDA